MTDTDDLEEYWKDIRPGWQPESSKAVVRNWSTGLSPPPPGNLASYNYQGCATVTPRFIWGWDS